MLPQTSKAVPTMTSLELVEVINSARDEGKPKIRHDSLMAKIVKVLGDAAPAFLGTVSRPQPTGGTRDYPCYYLPKREAELMVMSESYAVQAKVYDRMTELDAVPQPAFVVPTTFADALRLAAAQAEQIEQQAAKITTDAPKVAFAETIRALDGVCKVEDIAKTIGIGRNKLFKQMRADKVLLKTNLPYQKYIDREYFTVVEQEPYVDSEGVSHPTFSTRVTGAGQVFLARKYASQPVNLAQKEAA